LPRLKAILDAERKAQTHLGSSLETEIIQRNDLELAGIHFKGDRMYSHNILRVNYTTYDVRRSQDVINPNTDHKDIMVLSAQDPDSSHHEFDYARVIGIFHVNVIYTGPGMVDYRSRRLDFLWVRWFENLDDVPASKGWETAQLDTLRFLPMSDDDAFGFLDPSQVLRASHLIQSFMADRRHMDGRGISECAQNTQDWHQYLVNR
jgi:hypothetical protein